MGTRVATVKGVPMSIDRAEVRRLVAAGAQLVDVRDADDFARNHIVGAISLPLESLTASTAAALDRNRPVITYCHDFT